MAKSKSKSSKAARPTQKPSAPSPVKLPGAFRLLQSALHMLVQHWKVFGIIALLYGLCNVLLVQGFSAAGNLEQAKDILDQLSNGKWEQVVAGTSLFVYLLGSSGNAENSTAGTYQLIFALIFSLALIWLLRQLYAGHKVRVRDGFYRGMAPLIPFVLVLAVVAFQLLPLALGALVYGAVTSTGLAATGVEQGLWTVFFAVASTISLYLLSSSLFALYIVTLPDMRPLQALRSARQLVRGRRFAVLRKVLFLPVALIILSGILIVPLILFATPVAAWAFFVVSMFLLPIVHSYMYSLYRSLV
jgi:hypothetical protein